MHNPQILFLGNSESENRLAKFLQNLGCSVDFETNRVENLSAYDLTISYGYKHILSNTTLDTANTVPINLHISYLPYNRGMHPNFWAHFDGTPSGVSIHCIDEGIDTGDIIFQKLVNFDNSEITFKQTWMRLKFELEELFIFKIKEILYKDYLPVPQKGSGSFHLKSDLPNEFLGWDSEIKPEIERLRKIKFL